jgi:LmbE family N-acetylglucosaminyl deacetylase
MNKSIQLVFAHPDDESFGLGSTISKYTHQGIPVDLICATRGEVGTRVNVPKNVETGVACESELRTAAFILGIRNIYFLDYIDGESPARNRFVRLGYLGKMTPNPVILCYWNLFRQIGLPEGVRTTSKFNLVPSP